MRDARAYEIEPIGVVHSPFKHREDVPLRGSDAIGQIEILRAQGLFCSMIIVFTRNYVPSLNLLLPITVISSISMKCSHSLSVSKSSIPMNSFVDLHLHLGGIGNSGAGSTG